MRDMRVLQNETMTDGDEHFAMQLSFQQKFYLAKIKCVYVFPACSENCHQMAFKFGFFAQKDGKMILFQCK